MNLNAVPVYKACLGVLGWPPLIMALFVYHGTAEDGALALVAPDVSWTT